MIQKIYNMTTFTQANILKSISDYISSNSQRIGSYHIYSYNFLQTKLVIFFHDRKQVIEYTKHPDRDELIINSGFTHTKVKHQLFAEELEAVKYHRDCYHKFQAD